MRREGEGRGCDPVICSVIAGCGYVCKGKILRFSDALE